MTQPISNRFVTEATLPKLAASTWRPSTAYTVGQPIINPTGDLVTATIAHTSGDTYDASKFANAYLKQVDAANAYASRSQVARGLVAVNPTQRRLQGMPAVMATPPTVTIGAANAVSAITNPQVIKIENNPARRLGTPAGFGAAFPDSSMFHAPDNISYGGTAPSIGASGSWAVEFMIDGSQVEFQSKQQGGSEWRLRVDGQLVSATPQVGPTDSAGSGYRTLIDFAGVRQVRRITIEMSGPCRLGEVTIGPNDTLWAPDYPPGPRCIIIGDSFADGTAAASQITAFGKTFGDAMGWQNVRQAGEGSTGYLANPGGGKQTYRGRVPLDVTPWSPDVVIVMGSINDDSQAAANIGAEATLLFNAIKSAAPTAKLIVLLPFHLTATANQPAATTANRDAIAAAANGVADLVIDPIAEGWFTGTGRVGATAGTGNADLYLYSDSAHPTQAGHNYIGRRLALKVAAALDAGTLI